MSQFFTDMSDSPAFTERWNAGAGTVTIETSGLPSGSGSHALKLVKTSSGRYVASWNTPGTPSGDVEALFKWQATSIAVNIVGLYLHGGGSAGSEDAYYAQTGTSSAAFGRGRYISGTGATLSPVQTGLTLAANTWIWTRIQRTGTTFQQRTWLDGDSEPGTWVGTSTETGLSGGWIGVGGPLNTVTIWVAQIGVGTGGDPAPDSPLSTQSQAPRSLHQFRMRVAR